MSKELRLSGNFLLDLENLAEKLEDEQDEWFSNPRGFLKKPRFGRARSTSAIKKGLAKIMPTRYNIRYFVLDVKGRELKYYKSDDPNAEEKGNLDMNEIINIQISEEFDAPEYSLDLISETKNYTITADSYDQLLRWAYALNLARPSYKPTSKEIQYDKTFPHGLDIKPDEVLPFRWLEYEIVYEEQTSLMINLVGMVNRDKDGKYVNNLYAVSSFDLYNDGRSGVSELSQMISIKDFLIRVNDIDLTTCLRKEDVIHHVTSTPFPKTLYFIRDLLGQREGPKVEGMLRVNFPALQRPKFRYVEFIHDTLFFYATDPGGNINPTKSTSFQIDQVIEMNSFLYINSPLYADKFIAKIELKCQLQAYIHHYRASDEVLEGGTLVDTLELCFIKKDQFNRWRSALISPIQIDENNKFVISKSTVTIL